MTLTMAAPLSPLIVQLELPIETVEAARPDGDRKIGVIWHTQGSGKSLLMAFFAGLVVKMPVLAG